MNNCQFAGTIIENSGLETLKNGLLKCEFKMKVEKGGGSEKEFDITLQALSKMAEKFSPYLKNGTKALVNCSYEPYTFENKYGKTSTIHNFTAKDILLLSSPHNNSQNSFNVQNIDLPF